LRSVSLKYLLIITFLFLFSSPLAFAEDKAELKIRIINASFGEARVDSSIRNISTQLKGIFPFSSYQLIKTNILPLKEGSTNVIKLTESKTMEISTLNIKGSMIQLLVSVINNKVPILNTTFTLSNKGTLFLGGPKTPTGTLIIAISAE